MTPEPRRIHLLRHSLASAMAAAKEPGCRDGWGRVFPGGYAAVTRCMVCWLLPWWAWWRTVGIVTDRPVHL
jgi:hypothetical protein